MIKSVPERKGKHYVSRYTKIGESSNLYILPEQSQEKKKNGLNMQLI